MHLQTAALQVFSDSQVANLQTSPPHRAAKRNHSTADLGVRRCDSATTGRLQGERTQRTRLGQRLDWEKRKHSMENNGTISCMISCCRSSLYSKRAVFLPPHQLETKIIHIKCCIPATHKGCQARPLSPGRAELKGRETRLGTHVIARLS